ncbi:MAG: cytochrome c [Ferruginibacter sp.]|nr:cytochrome c [Ferruginibacter sp.]
MKSLIFLTIIFLAACNNPSEKAGEEGIVNINVNIVKGETLFKANCASCHKPNEKYVGPALEGVAKRWESKELLYAFIRNSQEVISRNAYAKKLYDEYKQSPMLPYPNLKDKDIDDILLYCNTYLAQ